MGGKAVEMISDSRLVVGQVKGELKARYARMQEYLSWVKRLQSGFDLFSLSHVSRSGNTHADSLVTLATSLAGDLPRIILVEHLDRTNKEAKGMVPIHEVRAGPSWMDLMREALEYVKKCDQCQRFAPNIHQPGGILNPLSSPWPFAQWGLDIVGPFPKAARNKRYLLVGTDYFTKWVKAEPLANIRDMDAKKFIWRNIVTRFGVLRTLISENGLQFDSKAFRKYCCELGITNRYSTPAYPQGNGETPFALTYGAEAVIPLEANFLILRKKSFTLNSNDELMGKNLDLIDERREKAMIHLAYYHQKLKQGYDANVKLRPLAPGDLVLRKVVAAAKNPSWGKLGPNWEGSY
ncbi:uncharacterized protein LOC115965767 [Quercus lobata]|uniref:uncharacterized protein LOC115965767 n=1 Tax=Quercus lobata TaxID=97700 RepID=UPI001246927D|nr:uncharacterized protein LOC115965767 [Quercus lobata]